MQRDGVCATVGPSQPISVGGVLGLLYGVGALVNSGGVKAPLRLPSARLRIGVRERLVFRWELKRPRGIIRGGQELLADYSLRAAPPSGTG